MLGARQAKLIAALRSGEYTQARDVLFNGEGHCCLGVACRVAGLDSEPHINGGYGFDGAKEYMPRSVSDYFAFRNTHGGAADSNAEGASLACLNDDGKTFEEIADRIEANPSVYFSEVV